jgi:hypothetical protein
MDPIIEAAAEQASETVALESSAVVAEAAAEATLLAAESAVSLANVQAAIVTAEAAETIREAEQTIEVIEGSLEWQRVRLEVLQSEILNWKQEVSNELLAMREAIQLLTLPLVDSQSQTPPNSMEAEVIAVVPTAEPGNLPSADVADQRAAETPVHEARKKTKRFL